jgi:hypothetical protein
VGDRSAGCAPEAGHLREPPHHVKQILAWRALSPSIPRAKRRDPGGHWGLTAQQRPSRSMLPCDECGRLASSTSPHGEAHISRYQNASEGRKESNSIDNIRCTEPAVRPRWGNPSK